MALGGLALGTVAIGGLSMGGVAAQGALSGSILTLSEGDSERVLLIGWFVLIVAIAAAVVAAIVAFMKTTARDSGEAGPEGRNDPS